MSRKIPAIGLLASIGVAFLVGFFGKFFTSELKEAVTMFCGLFIIIFGIWSAVLLLKKENAEKGEQYLKF